MDQKTGIKKLSLATLLPSTFPFNFTVIIFGYSRIHLDERKSFAREHIKRICTCRNVCYRSSCDRSSIPTRGFSNTRLFVIPVYLPFLVTRSNCGFHMWDPETKCTTNLITKQLFQSRTCGCLHLRSYWSCSIG